MFSPPSSTTATILFANTLDRKSYTPTITEAYSRITKKSPQTETIALHTALLPMWQPHYTCIDHPLDWVPVPPSSERVERHTRTHPHDSFALDECIDELKRPI